MNKRLLVITGIIAVLIAASMAYLALSVDDDEPSEQAQTSNTDQQDTGDTPEPTPNATAGTYVDYNADLVASTAGTKLLFFHAPWCPQCRALENSIEASTIPAGVTIFKVDYDSNQGLRQKYGVTIQTTLVKIDAQGNLVEKYVAYDDPEFAAVQANLLP